MKINAVQMMREARDRISREISSMTTDERIEYFRRAARNYEARAKGEAPGRDARLKAMGFSSSPGKTPAVKVPTSTRASESSAVSGGSLASCGTGYEAGEAAPAGAAISAKSGSDPD